MRIVRLLIGFAAITMAVPVCGAHARQGAAVPWTSYQAEQARTNGAILGPDYTSHSAAREASGRQCVRLDHTGQFLQFTAKSAAQGLVIRYSIPDSTDGAGIDATLSLYINGQFRAKLPMTSRYCYLYGHYPFSNHPSDGHPRDFWDELRLMPGAIHPGDTIRLQKNADDSAKYYLIDFVDLEQVPPLLSQPGNSLSVTTFGATPNDSSDDRAAFIAALAAAQKQHRTVWIPPGQFIIGGPLKIGSNITFQGAGMWYSTLVGAGNYSPGHRVAIEGAGSNIKLADFAIIGKLDYRNDAEPNDGIVGSFGTGSAIDNLWIEHTKTGAWLTNSDGLIVKNCRFRDTIADGINLCLGMENTTVRDCTARGTGDDCFAIWPATYAQSRYPSGHNRITHCTAQLPFLAQGFAIYGGDSNAIENCAAIDIPYGAGLFASTTFPTNVGFEGTTKYAHIQVLRAGDQNGAVGIVTDLTDLTGLRFSHIDIIDSAADGIKFISLKGRALADTKFDHISIINAGMAGAGCGVVAASSAVGAATLQNVSITNPKTAGFRNNTKTFKLIRISSGQNQATLSPPLRWRVSVGAPSAEKSPTPALPPSTTGGGLTAAARQQVAE